MILIFSRSLVGTNPQTDLVSHSLNVLGVEHWVLNPHDLDYCQCSLTQCDDAISLVFGERLLKPRVVYMANHWRCDAIVNLPDEIKYPTAFRSRVYQFMQDLRFSFRDLVWVPGRYEDLEQADSKPTLFQKASKCGLTVPEYTSNALLPHSNAPDLEPVYRKNLGFPFVISFDKKAKVEVAVTTTNVLFDPKVHEPDHQPWQWQSFIAAVGRVRCFVIGKEIWSVVCHESGGVRDYRQVTQVEGRHLDWAPYSLPEPTGVRLKSLMSSLGLDMAAPEFLLSTDGQHVLIDLNPCGDWLGFFPRDSSQKIGDAIARLLVDRTK